MNAIAKQFKFLNRRINDALTGAARTDIVKILCVSKTRSIEQIHQAIAAGQYCFAENYLQEALPKIEALAAQHLQWHFIGRIQANKTRKIAEHFSWVQSVDNQKVAQRLNDQRPAELPALNVCIQVNIDHDQNKGGINLKGVETLAGFIEQLPNLTLRGLMTIPRKMAEADTTQKTYRQLNLLYQSLRQKGFPLDTLSMGMSNDLELAIAEGATMVRPGRCLFTSDE